MRGEQFNSLMGNLFNQKVVGTWNLLPEVVVEAGTKTTFKIYLNKYIDRKGLEG